MRRLIHFLLALLFLCVTLSAQPQKHLVVFMTDFGHQDDAVAICKGVMISVDPEVRIVDLMHDVTPYSIADGARFLAGTAPYYPEGTVFVVVIDPTVGSKRKAIVAHSKKGQYYVLPDNGLLTFVQDRDGIDEVHDIENPKWMIGAGISSTFHGRDIFSPSGAHAARGDAIAEAGPAMDPAQLVRLSLPAAVVANDGVTGQAFATDGPFGNLITNIRREQFATLGYAIGDTVTVKVGEHEFALPWQKTFSDVPVGKPLLYVDSRGRMALAINQGNFSKTNGITPPLQVSIAKKK